MVNIFNGRIAVIAVVFGFLVSSCATMDTMFSSESEDESDVKEISVDQRLQISIPLPDNSIYLRAKTIIFGEGERFSGVLYLLHDMDIEEFATIKVSERMCNNSASEITIGPKTTTTINRSLNIDSGDIPAPEEPFEIQ